MAVDCPSKGADDQPDPDGSQELVCTASRETTPPPGSVMGMIPDANASEANVERLAVAVLPVRRVGRPEDIANACASLCSEASSYVTGQIIGVNGGRVVT